MKQNRRNKNKVSEKQLRAIRRNYAIKATSGKRIEAPYPHFRYYKKSHHPALIVGEQMGVKTNNNGVNEVVEEYRFRKVMHSKKDGSRNNEMVYPNPDPNDKDPMYIGRRIRHDIKDNFENYPLPWIYRRNN